MAKRTLTLRRKKKKKKTFISFSGGMLNLNLRGTDLRVSPICDVRTD